MKLYLSSFLIGDHSDLLVKMAGGRGARMAVITNALDYISLEAQLEYARTKFDPLIYFAEHGFDPSLIDLRFYFGRSESLRDVLSGYRVVWAVGGNAFLLRRAMRESGFDEVVRELIAGGSVYAGWSAGACVAGTSLRPLSLMDDPMISAPGYGSGGAIWEGLGLVPGAIIPHYASDHPEAEAAAKAAQWAVENGIQYLTLRDGDVLIRNGGDPEVLARTG